MGQSRTALVSVLVGWALIAVAAPAALAGTPGHWSQITDPTARNIDEVSLARTADGMLHAAWSRPTPSDPGAGRDLVTVPISPSGSVGAPVLVQSDWASMENPSLVATGGQGLEVFVGGMRSTNFDETNANLSMLASSDGGNTWALYPFDLTRTGAADSSDVSAALGSGGNPFETWGSSSCLCVHQGLSQTTPDNDFQQGLGDFGYEPGIAFDSTTGQLYVAWYSNGTGHSGMYAAPVDQSSGAMAGSQVQMPGTSDLTDGPFSGRTQIVARTGGGLYVAYEGGYPTHTRVLLWHIGAAKSSLLGQAKGDVTSVGVSGTPTGRLWIFWSARSSSGSPIVYARRSDAHAAAWGATVAVKPPAGASTSWNLVGNGQASLLDLVGSFSVGSDNAIASWHTQVLPGLSLNSSPNHVKARTGKSQKVTFYVTDAGAGVSGAKVQVGKAHAKTNGKGKVTLMLGPFRRRGHLTASASAQGYTGASLSIIVK
jgi:hypothetical protein